MERNALPVVEVKPDKPSKIPLIGRLIDRLRTHQTPVTRFTMPESRAQEVADDFAKKLREKGRDATGKTRHDEKLTF